MLKTIHSRLCPEAFQAARDALRRLCAHGFAQREDQGRATEEGLRATLNGLGAGPTVQMRTLRVQVRGRPMEGALARFAAHPDRDCLLLADETDGIGFRFAEDDRPLPPVVSLLHLVTPEGGEPEVRERPHVALSALRVHEGHEIAVDRVAPLIDTIESPGAFRGIRVGRARQPVGTDSLHLHQEDIPLGVAAHHGTRWHYAAVAQVYDLEGHSAGVATTSLAELVADYLAGS